jgi:mono/diheme cytochrome c family protein
MKRCRGIARRSLIPATAAFLGFLFLTGQGIGKQEAPAGAPLYRANCAICHGEKGDGKGIAAPSFGGKVADFTNPELWKTLDDGKIVKVILKGQGRMPAQSVSPEEARAIVEYLKSTFKTKYGS